MTTIAWDGKSVAADSMMLAGNGQIRPGSASKIARVGDTVYAITGALALFWPLIHWHSEGAKIGAKPGISEKDGASFFVFKKGKCFCYPADSAYPDELFPPDAWGYGGDFAIGALMAGADARKAVEIACLVNPHTGGSVEIVDLSFQRRGEASAP